MLKSVFIAESVDPIDFYERRLDGHAANEILKIRNLRTEYRVALNEDLMKKAIREASDGSFEVFHLSSHGNDDCIGLADNSTISWDSFADLIKPFSGTKRSLVMATCGGGHQKLTNALVKKGVVFGWFFGSTADRVSFSDSCLAWSILYNRLADDGFNRKSLKKTLLSMNEVLDGDFVYRRWDGDRYLHYPFNKK